MQPEAGQSVTVTIRSHKPYSFYEGQPIKIKGYKRWYMVVETVSTTDNITQVLTNGRYKPSPKSQLRNPSIYSKNKYKLIL